MELRENHNLDRIQSPRRPRPPVSLRLLAIGIRAAIWLFLGFAALCRPATAQQAAGQEPDYTKNPEVFPHIFTPYRSQPIPKPAFQNSAAVPGMIHDGKLELSVDQLVIAVVENNLDIAFARYNRFFSQTDLLRARAGGAPRGSQGVSFPGGLFSGAIGASLGNSNVGVSPANGPAINTTARQVSFNPRGSYDPAMGVDLSFDRSSSPLNNQQVSGVANSITHTATLQTRFSQAFTSGTTLSVSFNTQRTSTNQLRSVFTPAYTPSLGLVITQELLNGFGFSVNRRFFEVANTGRQIAREVYRQQVITTLALAQNSYWNLVAFRETVRAAEQSLQVAQQLYEDNKKQAEVGTLAPLDVISAESEVAARRRDLIVAQTNLQQAEVQLKTLFSKEMDAALAAARIEATDALPEPQDADIPKLEDALAAAQKNRPELFQAQGNILNQEAAVRFTKDALKPTVNLFGQFISSSLYGEQIVSGAPGAPSLVLPGGWGRAMTQLAHFNYPDYAIGLSVVIPIKNRSAQADNIRARLEEQQAEYALQGTRNQIALEVRNAVIGLMQAKSQVEAAQKAVQFEKQTVDAEQKKLAAGTSTPYQVVLVQRDLLSAQLAEVQARSNYAKAHVEMDRSMGVMLEKYRIDPQEAPRGEFPSQ
jgi:outer membrane protein